MNPLQLSSVGTTSEGSYSDLPFPKQQPMDTSVSRTSSDHCTSQTIHGNEIGGSTLYGSPASMRADDTPSQISRESNSFANNLSDTSGDTNLGDTLAAFPIPPNYQESALATNCFLDPTSQSPMMSRPEETAVLVCATLSLVAEVSDVEDVNGKEVFVAVTVRGSINVDFQSHPQNMCDLNVVLVIDNS